MYVLLSGGMDSLVVLAKASRECYRIAAVLFNYGQSTYPQEQRAARSISRYYHVPLQELTLPTLGSPDAQVGPSTSYEVHHRNAVLITITASLAYAAGHYLVGGGWHGGDHTYPDCRPEFFNALEKAIAPTLIYRPFVHVGKSVIAKEGDALKVPWRLSWSCYHPGPVPCGKCPACIIRKEALECIGLK